MRVLEIVVLLAAVLALIWPRLSNRRWPGTVAAIAAFIVAIVQIGVEGGRWQFYGLFLFLGCRAAWRVVRPLWSSPPVGVRSRRLFIGGGLLVIGVTALLAVALPVPSLPLASGALPIGTTSWTVIDPDRTEVYDESGGSRRFVVQAWYPTTASGDPAPWVSDAPAFSAELAPLVGLPGFALRHLELVETTALADVAVAAGEWPVVVYSHGWGGFRNVQSDFAEHLASRGFVVLSLDHTYGAAVTLFPHDELGKGDVLNQNLAALPDRTEVGEAAYQEAIELLEATFAEDVREALDQLAAGDAPALLGNELVTDRVGLSGHSTGGGAMYRLCLTDDRCAGVLGFDPWVEPVPTTLLARGLDVPVLSIRSEEWQGNNNDALLRQFHADSPGSEGLYVIEGTTHVDFTLQAFLTPLAEVVGASGPADDTAVHAAVNAASLDFFDRHLRGGPGAELSELIERD